VPNRGSPGPMFSCLAFVVLVVRNFNYNAYTQFAGYGLNNLAFYNTFLKEKEVIAHGYGKISINYSSGAITAYNENIRISNFELLDSNDVVRKRIKMYSDGTKLTTVA
jgi:hypothetical protein